MSEQRPHLASFFEPFEREDVINEVAQAIARSGLVVDDMDFCRDLAEVALIEVARIINQRAVELRQRYLEAMQKDGAPTQRVPR